MTRNKVLIFLLIILIPTQARTEQNRTRVDLPYAIEKAISSTDGKNLFLASEEQDVKDFSVALFSGASAQIGGITPEKTNLNYQLNQDNPLYNKKIKLLDVLTRNNNPVVVAYDKPSDLALILNYNANNNIVLTLPEVKDSAGNPCREITSISTGKTNVCFATVTGKDSTTFGQNGSGLAIVKLVEITNENKSISLKLQQLAYKELPKTEEKKEEAKPTEATQPPQEKAPEVETPICSQPITYSSDFLKINTDVQEIDKVVDMHWSDSLEALYLAFQVKTGAQENSGAYAIAIGGFAKEDIFILTSFAHPGIFTAHANNEIIGTLTPNTLCSLSKVRTMLTSTGLDYLIVVGGNGSTEETAQKVYALPIFNDPRYPTYRGRLASVTKGVDTSHTLNNPHYLAVRHFRDVASTPQEIYTKDHVQAQVGAGKQLPGDISSVVVIEDTVFVSTTTIEISDSGIFYSQALFDGSGMIKGWTHWRRAASIFEPVRYFALSNPLASLIWFNQTESKHSLIKSISWSESAQNTNEYAQQLTEQFKSQGGINTLSDYTSATPGLDNQSLLIAAGGSKLAITQTQDNSNKTFFVEHETLKALKHITCTEIVTDNTKGLIFAGGLSGLVVMKKEGNLTTAVSGQEFSYMTVGNYRNVKKIVADNNCLYVLTDKELQRINLANSRFETNTLDCTCVAQARELGCTTFYDCIISEKLGLIATNKGLMRIGNNQDIRSATNSKQAEWSLVALPEQVNPIIKLYAYCQNGRAQDVSRSAGGYLHVLGSYRGKNISHIHRLAIEPTDIQPVHDATVTVIAEVIAWGEKSTFATPHIYKDLFTTDGAFYFSAPVADIKKQGLICGLKKKEITPLPLQETDRISCITRNSATGSWLIAGTFGLIVHE